MTKTKTTIHPDLRPIRDDHVSACGHAGDVAALLGDDRIDARLKLTGQINELRQGIDDAHRAAIAALNAARTDTLTKLELLERE